MSPFGIRSFNRNWVTNDMISCTKRGKMSGRILAVRFSLCPHIPAKITISSFGGTLQDVFQTYHHLWTQIIMCKRHIILHSARFLSICPSISWMFFGINTVEFRCQAKDFDRFRFLKKVQHPYLPYFEEHKKSKKMPTYPILKSIKS